MRSSAPRRAALVVAMVCLLCFSALVALLEKPQTRLGDNWREELYNLARMLADVWRTGRVPA